MICVERFFLFFLLSFIYVVYLRACQLVILVYLSNSFLDYAYFSSVVFCSFWCVVVVVDVVRLFSSPSGEFLGVRGTRLYP